MQNLLTPGDELGFRVDFKQPYVFGGADTKKTALAISAFNVRKVSGVFIPGAKALPLGLSEFVVLPVCCGILGSSDWVHARRAVRCVSVPHRAVIALPWHDACRDAGMLVLILRRCLLSLNPAS